ncbi:exo-alpha-sialidase [Plantactinospora mayteni]|uniref:exo-alpha-sialidase n=1 Tax=Plantactinospora mayteni TaxID=566021 RepID=A0ABQ4EIX9_9ACTN|nr:exo-alpha-sialidase [Plantactinospora mayteni]GIG94708.1 neuraminidase [Plantactinospora mayteni]
MVGVRRGLAGALAGIVLAVGLPPATPGLAATAPVTVFKDGDGGYACVRIPAVVRTDVGTLLAFGEGRNGDCGDTGDIDIVLRRSITGGRTWERLQVIAAGNGSTRHNPTPVVDADSGRISLLSTQDYRTPWLQHSTDDGLTWTDPDDISDQARLPGWGSMITGPAHGIQLTRGDHDGRLVVGMNHQTNGRKGGVLLYSDDGGLNWQIGAESQAAAPALQVQELSVFERPDGSLYALARNERRSATSTAHTAYAVSTDGGQSWRAPFTAVPGLVIDDVQASTLAIRATDQGSAYDRVLVAGPAGDNGQRERMTLRSSFDGGLSWQDASAGLLVHAGAAAYSDLLDLGDGSFGVFYEAGEGSSPYDSIRFVRFTEGDLDLPPNPSSLTGNQRSAALLTADPAQRHVFAASPGGGLYHWFQEPTLEVKRGTWGSGITGKVATFVDRNQQHAFARGTDGSLVHRLWDSGSSSLRSEVWAGAGSLAGAPTVLVTDYQQHAFARGTDGSLRHWWYDHGTRALRSQTWAGPGSLAGDPVSIRYGDQQHVWAAGPDGTLQHWWWDPDVPVGVRQESWGGSVRGGLTAFVHNGQLHVFGRTADNALAHWYRSPGALTVARQVWAGGSALAGDPISFVHGAQQHVFAREAGNRLGHWWWDPDYSVRYAAWPGTVHSDPIALVVGAQQHVFGATATGELGHWWWDSAAGIQQENWGGEIATG